MGGAGPDGGELAPVRQLILETLVAGILALVLWNNGHLGMIRLWDNGMRLQ